jgi:hypothetical protein
MASKSNHTDRRQDKLPGWAASTEQRLHIRQAAEPAKPKTLPLAGLGGSEEKDANRQIVNRLRRKLQDRTKARKAAVGRQQNPAASRSPRRSS